VSKTLYFNVGLPSKIAELTPYIIAHCRLVETHRYDALFDDHLSKHFLKTDDEKTIKLFMDQPMFQLFYTQIVLRTRIIDEKIIESITDSGIMQIINLGCGFDTRPYRLKLPASLSWINVDRTDILAQQKIQLSNYSPHCRLEFHALDLTDLSNVEDFINEKVNKSLKTLVITEGLLVYMPMLVIRQLLTLFSKLDNCMAWITDIATPLNVTEVSTDSLPIISELLKKMHSFLTPIDDIFNDSGWTVTSSQDIAVEGFLRGRPMSKNGISETDIQLVTELRSMKWSKLSYILHMSNSKLQR